MPETKAIQEMLAQLAFANAEREKMNARLAEVEAKVAAIEQNTKDLIEMFEKARAGLAMLGMVGNFVKWAAMVGAAGVSLWALLTGKKPT